MNSPLIAHKAALFLTVLAAFLCAPGISSGNTASDLDTIRERLVAPLLIAPKREDVSRLMDGMKPDGSFSGVDYADTNPGYWKTVGHFSNLLVLSSALATPASPLYGDDKVLDAAMNALDFWLAHDFINPNWWWNQIGAPGKLANCLLLLDSSLEGDRRAKAISILERATISMTGANLADVAYITFKRGILEEKPNVVANAVDSILNEIRITMDEGIQADYSFHQHGSLLYNHGYGQPFMENCSDLALLVKGTEFAFPKEKIDILNGLILDGTRWMTRFDATDYGATGRTIARIAGSSGGASYLRGVSRDMLELPTGREQEYRDLLAQLDGSVEASITGNRHFWRGDIMTHHRPGWYASARMFSNRLRSTDAAINGEGILDHHLADGCTYIMRTGREYHNIFPVWDWQNIPGTTIEQTARMYGDIRRYGTRPFVGGVSDGMYGLSVFDFERDGLTAKKAWFFFDSGFVCLGAGIGCRTSSPVVTTVNQCFLKGTVLVSDGEQLRPLERGRTDLEGAGLIWHDGIGYIFPGKQRVRLENEARTGSWSRINTNLSAVEITLDVFTLTLDHGIKPDAGAYAYIVAPGLPSESAIEYAQSPPVEILSNSSSLQAVRLREPSIIAAAFYSAGKLTVDSLTVGVDVPCLVMIREEGGARTVTVSNPRNQPATVTVSIASPGKEPSTLRFELPDGMKAGSSETVRSAVTETSVTQELPEEFTLHPPYPNPFNNQTTIRYSLPESGHANISIYTITGQKIATLVNEFRGAGSHTVTWNGEGQSSGIYICSYMGGNRHEKQKMLLLK